MSTAFTQPPPPPPSASSSSIMIVIIIIASAVIISASIYLLLRIVSKRFRRSFSTADDVVSFNAPNCRVVPNHLIDSLPLFTFRSVANNGDCAVCLSKFQPNDQLRLLPLCCHAFHAACINKWIASNQTCPLCRSTVFPSASPALDQILSNPSRSGNAGSFRLQLGSISRRVGEAEVAGARRTYSLGAFDYIVDDCVYEVAATHRRGYSDVVTSNGKESAVGIPQPESEEVHGRRNWLREYVDRMTSVSSRTMSFRSSTSFFAGSSRRSEAAVVPEDVEANWAGEETSEIFRWISGF